MAAITEAMVQHADCGPDHLHVIIQDVPKESWGRAGRLGIDNEPERTRTLRRVRNRRASTVSRTCCYRCKT